MIFVEITHTVTNINNLQEITWNKYMLLKNQTSRNIILEIEIDKFLKHKIVYTAIWREI